MELEVIVSKRLDSAYRRGLSHDWQKTKCEVSETFAVVGFGVDDNGRIDGILLAESMAVCFATPALSAVGSAPAQYRPGRDGGSAPTARPPPAAVPASGR